MKTLSEITTGLLFEDSPLFLATASIACQSKSVIKTLAPTTAFLPIVIDSFEPITTPLIPQLSPMLILADESCVEIVVRLFIPMRLEVAEVLISTLFPIEILEPGNLYINGRPIKTIFLPSRIPRSL